MVVSCRLRTLCDGSRSKINRHPLIYEQQLLTPIVEEKAAQFDSNQCDFVNT